VITVDELAIHSMEYAHEYYRRAGGTPTSEVTSFRYALQSMVELFGTCRVRDFGPLKLKAVRTLLVESGDCRTDINRQIARLKLVFSWGAENEIVPPDVAAGLREVKSLRSGRTTARESEPVLPVDDATVEATLPYLSALSVVASQITRPKR
jgi:hypothetical protein